MKEYPQIELSEWTMVGEGFNGQAFVSHAHPGVMLKLITTDMGSVLKVEQEFYAAKTAYETGLPTPQVYEIVRNGNYHGYMCQVIEGKKSIARLCADAPDRISEYAQMMAEYGKALHNMPITPNEYVIPLKTLLKQALQSSALVTDEQRERLSALVDSMPDTTNCLHGDFQPGNIIFADGQYYWIDLGWLSQGYYMMDLAHLYKMMIEDSMIPQVQDLTHLTQQQMIDFWNAFAKAYTGTKDVEALNRELRPYAALDLVRTGYLHHMDNPEILAFFKARITQDLS
ncbi:MAG: phosphotransferase [Bacteroidaceae bacterium]|nr:phosphotransferase [Bacteroidaceae bacterium]